MNNDAQQWWYFLVSTIAIVCTIETFVLGMVGSFCYWRADNPWVHWWLRSVSVFSSGIAFCLPTDWHGNSVNEENWWWRYCLISTVTTLLTIGAFLLETLRLSIVVEILCHRRADNSRLQQCLRAVSALCSGIVFYLPTCRIWNSVNGEDWHWRWCLISTFTTTLSIAAFLL